VSKALTYVEIDVDFCANVYGVAPCQAALGVTGDDKCFNTLKTCQDRLNFINDPATIRFAEDTGYLPRDIEAIPSITSVSFNPATISLGKDLGQRATLTVVFKDHRDSDTAAFADPYYAERDYDAFKQGTFWGKFRARQPYLKGRSIRLIRGYLGQALSEMETRHYIIESFNGPTPGGSYTLEAKDVLKLADGDRAQAPFVSNGFLVAGIDDNDLSLTLSPAGIGNEEHPTSGYVAIGGEEIMSFTRSGDVLTIVRGQLGTTAASHDSQDRVQLCLRYVGEDPADIIYDLLTEYAGIPAEYINLTQWTNETSSFLQRLYTSTIADPTDVKQLVSELIEQAALAMWWDDENQLIQMKVLRSIPTDAFTFDEDNTLEGSLQVKEQPNLRASQIWTYYGQRNPLRPVDEPDNYRSTLATVNLQAETDEGQAAIIKIFSRWIPAFGRDTAERLNDIQLGRYQVPPRNFQLQVMRDSMDDPLLGGGYQIGSWSIQDEFGAPAFAPVQITRLNPMADRFEIEAEEMLFEELNPADLIDRTIVIDSNTLNVNLRDLHDSIYPEPVAFESPSITVTCIIEEGVLVGSSSNTVAAFIVGDWPAGVTPLIRIFGRIQGYGGDGGKGSEEGSNARDGEDGGTALYARDNATVVIEQGGGIWGGAGGGGGMDRQDDDGNLTGWGGGGGAGYLPGSAGASFRNVSGSEHAPTDGTPTAGGIGGGPTGSGFFPLTSGAGGDPGEDGQPTQGIPSGGADIKDGGDAGLAIDGISFLNLTDSTPTGVIGDTVN
jgi:hypothetical protein